MSSPKAKLDYALEALAMGLAVVPLGNKNKKPIHEHGVSAPLTTVEDVKAQWKYTPDANIGVTDPTGRFVIIDLDMKNGKDGTASFRTATGTAMITLQMEHCIWQTWSGGFQVVFRADEAFKNTRGWLNGVDIRSVGGYGIYPGSTVTEGEKSGTYKWINEVVPEKLFDHVRLMLPKPDARSEHVKHEEDSSVEADLPEAVDRAREYLRHRKPAIEGQGGNDQTFKTFCDLRDMGISLDTAMKLVMEDGGWNSHCVPPWDEDELLYGDRGGGTGPATSAYKNGQRDFGANASISHKFAEVDAPPDDGDVEVAKALQGAKAHMLEKENSWATAGYSSLDNLFALPSTHATVINEWIPDRGMSIIRGFRGTGKTAFLVDLGMHVACDKDWHSNPTQKGWTVIYFAGEDDFGTREMMQAWVKKHGCKPEDGRFIFFSRIMRLLNDDDVIEALKAVRALIGNRTKVLIILDTWQRAIAGMQKNEGPEMQRAVDSAEAFARQFGGPVLGAFHPPKGNVKTTAGAAEQENSSHSIIQLEKLADGTIVALVERIKGDRDGSKIEFKLSLMQIAADNGHGLPRKSVYVDYKGGSSSDGKAMSPVQQDRVQKYARFLYRLVSQVASGEFKSLSEVKTLIKSIYEKKEENQDFIQYAKAAGVEEPLRWASPHSEELKNLWEGNRGLEGIVFEAEPGKWYKMRCTGEFGKGKAQGFKFEPTDAIPQPVQDGSDHEVPA